MDVTVDAAKIIGTIKPLQDLGLGPLNLRGSVDLSHYFKELGVRNVRLHDVPWVYSENVQDMNYVFPNDAADASKPESYDFALTDHYIESITKLGINIIYRLGYSAELHEPKHTKPPASYEKWADIAAHVVQHYDQGWANGPQSHIKYWEIWEEPDIEFFFASKNPEDYYRLYDVTARALKSVDPSIKVGGPALADELEFLEGFLKYCSDHKTPVDFVSWHSYGPTPDDVATRGKRVRALMIRYGFGKAESILDEWSYLPADMAEIMKTMTDATAKQALTDLLQGEFGAAYNAAVLTELQDASVDIATFYTGTTLSMGLFTADGLPVKAYDAFLAFRHLLDSPRRLSVRKPDRTNVTALAGMSEDDSTVRVLVSHMAKESATLVLHMTNLPWKGAAHYDIQTVDKNHTLTESRSGEASVDGAIPVTLDGLSVVLVTVKH